MTENASSTKESKQNGSALPIEIILKIVDYHRDHRYNHTLYSCALVCRALSHLVRTIVYNRVSIDCANSTRNARLKNILLGDSRLGSTVQQLTLGSLSAPQRKLDVNKLAEDLPLDQFIALRLLEITSVSIPSIHSALDLLAHFPSCETLKLSFVDFDEEKATVVDRVTEKNDPSSSMVSETASEAVSPPPPPSPPASLLLSTSDHLPFSPFSTMSVLNVWSVTVNPDIFTHHLEHRAGDAGLHFRTLMLDNLLYVGPTRYLEWTRLLRATSTTLRSVEVSIWDGPVPDTLPRATEFESALEYELDALSGCIALRYLTFRYRHVNSSSGPGWWIQVLASETQTPRNKDFATLLTALCVYFEGGHHPELERLSLSLLEHDAEPQTVPGPLRTRFADALTLRGTRLKKLTVMVPKVLPRDATPAVSPVEMLPARENTQTAWMGVFDALSERGVEVAVIN
ncbi:uncharacterized protein BXZ73DRAFT_99159 [Epithele typhae]|uniref:uncharacterized protein n=1 Tax=Epithele typhae TaxID=378194 RepID=UPI002007B8DF|nr:uncharacterized protein BXZ73DRAFT_99159 [Epithele typhae]KAH9940161.1 hypothetical protein BXZ73DRAFT_99159 [Epithele typhae]